MTRRPRGACGERGQRHQPHTRCPRRRRAIGAWSLVAVLLAGLAACADAPSPSVSPSVSPTATPSALVDGALPPTPPPEPGREVFGFVPYWEMDEGIAAHLEATPLTTLALFSVTHTAKGAISTGKGGYRLISGPVGRRLIAEAHARGARVELVYSSFGTARNRRLFESSTLQAAVTASLVGLADTLGVDGINVDVESLDPLLVPAYGGFIGSLRSALRAGDPARQVSVATTANPLGAAMALAATEADVDRVFMMAYDYRTAGSEPGATTPLARRDGSERTVGWSLDLYAALGVPVERTILGLPLYGYAWPVIAPVVGAPASGRGMAWIPRRHLDLLTNPGAVPVRDDEEVVDVYFVASDGRVGPPAPPSVPTPSAAAGGEPSSPATGPVAPSVLSSPTRPAASGVAEPVTWQAIYVDSPDTLAVKMQLALDRGLAGVGFWAVGYERGLTGYTELMRRFAEAQPLR
jgi:hypothetical protein